MKNQFHTPSRKHRVLNRTVAALASLAIGVCFCACTRTEQKSAGPLENITIAYSTLPETALAQVAQSRGYYREEGLEVTAHLFPYGKRALADLLAGKADFATVAETPAMFAIMNGEKISVIATIHTSNLGHAILARKDKGILAIGDLKGMKIGVTLGTTSDFYLNVMLVTHGIARKDVQVVDLKAEEIPDALARGDVDAVTTFTLYTALTLKKLGDRVITFRDRDINWYPFNVVATQEFIRKYPDKVNKLLRALVKAEEYVRENPVEAQKIVADFSGIEIDIIRSIWADASFTVALDQSLVLALEDESRWAINNRLTNARKVPNYLEFIYLDGLKTVKSGAVSIIR